ncbi:hypothetical protein M413DRAFT_61970, partial [Hebeloma cylindrosporum]
NLKRFPHCILLTRVGQFYESYFDQAHEVSRLLNIKLTSKKWSGSRIAMSGFPLIHLDRHLKTLVQQEQRFVAMCEEFPLQSNVNSKEFERRITRIITPGTLIDESFLNPLDNNYLLAISLPSLSDAPSQTTGLAWIDVSTGEFYSKLCSFESLRDELARIAPREIVLSPALKATPSHRIFSALANADCPISYTGSLALETDLPDPSLRYNPPSSFAIALLTKFLKENLLEHMPLLERPIHEGAQEIMQIDSHTIQDLEIRESIYEGGTKGCLLSVVKRTTTNGGAWMLARWLCSPSTSISEINARQSLVAFFYSRIHFRMDICEILKEVDDIGRVCQRFLLGRGDFSDLIAIHSTIQTWSSLKKRCEQEKAMEASETPNSPDINGWAALDALFLRMNDLGGFFDTINSAIVINPENQNEIADPDDNDRDLDAENNIEPEEPVLDKAIGKTWAIKPDFSEKLTNLQISLQVLLRRKDELENNLKATYNAPSLTLRSSNGQGMYLHIARAAHKKKLESNPAFYSIGETQSTKSYVYREWSELGIQIAETSTALNLAEKEVLEILRREVVEYSHQLRQNAQVIDELDIAVSFSRLAYEMNFVRPEIRDDGSYHVVNGRHPSVEMGLLSSGRQFTPNTLTMTPSSNLHIITGPNMAGKSTFLRQTALIAILAQVGSFVPADEAQISIVDKLFSRIGAKDDLFSDRSTFMVEMLETADILRRATEKSLVIMDEVGRGTTVKDGLAIAFATLHHLATINRSRCLFATHFHELAEMLGSIHNHQGSGVFKNVRFYCSDVDDAGDGHFAYSYRLRPGINHDSHGLKVASIAGVPPSAMAVATDTLSWLRGRESSKLVPDYNIFLKSALKSTV